MINRLKIMDLRMLPLAVLHRLFHGLAHVAESTGQVEHPLGWLQLATLHEELVLGVKDEGGNCCSRIEIEFKTAIFTLPALFTCFHEMRTAAFRTVSELFQYVHNVCF